VAQVIRGPWGSLRPYPREPMWQALQDAALRIPDKIALVEADGARSTYRELWNASCGVAAFLQREANVGEGQTVALASLNSREFVAAMYGSILAGARVSPLPRTFQADEAAAQLADCDATIVFAPSPLSWTLEQLAIIGELPQLERVYALEDVWSMAKSTPARLQRPAVNPHADVALLPYSSGTSGLPKGVELTHSNLTAASRQLAATGLVDESSVVFSIRLFYNAIRLVFATGATGVAQQWLDPERTLATMEAHRVTHLFVRPSFLRALVHEQHAHARDISSLRVIETGGEPLPAATAAEAERLLDCRVVQGYHLTETAGAANRVPVSEAGWDTVGWPLADTEERIADLDSGRDVAPGRTGELLIRGPQVTAAYWKQPEVTRQSILRGGWLRTGDVARRDTNGRVVIVDRAKEVIKVRGMQVAPAEVEAVLLEHPAVREAAVVGVVSADEAEAPKAFVVLAEGQTVSPSALMRLVADRLAPHKQLADVEFVASLPRNAQGKVLRRILSEERPG